MENYNGGRFTMQTFNTKHAKICAFCQNWFDPACSAIQPKAGDFFAVDEKAKKKCMILKLDRPANCSCNKFKNKF